MVPGSDPLVGLVDEAMHAEVVRRRNLRRGLADRAAASATWIGTLRDLAEQRVPVAIHLAGGRVHRGRLTAVAADHLVVVGDGAVTVVVAKAAIRQLRPQADLPRHAVQGDRCPGDNRLLPEALEDLLAHGVDVTLGLQDVADTVYGTVETLGEDVLTVRSVDGRLLLVPLEVIADIVWGGA